MLILSYLNTCILTINQIDAKCYLLVINYAIILHAQIHKYTITYILYTLLCAVCKVDSHLIQPPPELTQNPSVLVYIPIHVAKSQIIVK